LHTREWLYLQIRPLGFFNSFDFTAEAKQEIERVKRMIGGLEIIPITVEEIRYRV